MSTNPIQIIVRTQGADKAGKDIKGIARESDAAAKALGFLRRALAALGVAVAVRQFIRLGDTYRILQNRIALVTDSERARIAVSRELQNIAVETFSTLEATVETYSRIAVAVRDYGFAQQDALTITRALNQALIISGTNSTEAAASLRRLTQGIVSNSVRVDELRTVLAQLPAVGEILSRELGISTNAIRQLAIRGEIDAQNVAQAFLNAADEINAEFQKITPTVGQAFQGLRAQVTATIGEFNEVSGAGASLANAIVFITQNFQDLFDTGIAVLAELRDGFAIIFDFLFEETENYGTFSGDTLEDILRNVGEFINRFVGSFVAVGAAFAEIFRSLLDNSFALIERIGIAVVEFITFLIRSIASGFESVINKIIRGLNSITRAVERVTRTSIGSFRELDLGIQNIRVQLDPEQDFRNPLKSVTDEFFAGFEAPEVGTNFAENVINRLNQARADRAERGDFGELQRQRDLLRLNDDRLARLAEEIESQERVNALRGDRSVLAAQEIALEEFDRKVKRSKLQIEDELQQAELDRLRTLVATNAELRIRNELDREVERVTRDLQDQIDLLQLTTVEREREADIVQLTNAFREAGLDIDERQVETIRQLRTELQQRTAEEQILNQVFGDRAQLLEQQRATERLLANEQDEGRRRALERLQAEQRLASRQGDPTLAAGFDNALDRLFLSVSDVAGNIERALTNAFQGAEDALVEFVTTGEINFSRFVDSILSDLTRLLAQQAVLALFNNLTGGTSGAFSLLGGAFGGARQDGGPVSPNRAFLVGEDGPELFTPGRSGTILPNGASAAAPAPNNVTVVNVMDPNMVAEALNDPDAQEVIVNIISKNSRRISRVLGEK